VARNGRGSANWGGGIGACGFIAPGARAGAAALTALAGDEAIERAAGFGAGRAGCAKRGNLPDLALAAIERDAAGFALRGAGFAAFRAAGRLGAGFLAAGFLVFEAFFAGISFSLPVKSSAGL